MKNTTNIELYTSIAALHIQKWLLPHLPFNRSNFHTFFVEIGRCFYKFYQIECYFLDKKEP